jgi:precorrin-6B methylase 2
MHARPLIRSVVLTLSVSLATAAAVSAQATSTAAPQTKPATPPAQETPKTFEPQVGQAGKDVVWVPTPQSLVDKMLEMGKVTPKDYVIDLGSGDGRTVITAAKRGSTAMGIEYNPDMVELSKKNAIAAGVTDKATFMKADLFETDFSKAQVITMFLLPSINMKLRPKLLDMKPGTRIVSNSFTMEDWQADQTETVKEDCPNWCTAYMWIVPAKVEGTWQVGKDALTLKQQFQMLSGTLGATPISDAKMSGEEITFHVGNVTYTGHVSGNTIKGSTTGGGPASWTASRSGSSSQN